MHPTPVTSAMAAEGMSLREEYVLVRSLTAQPPLRYWHHWQKPCSVVSEKEATEHFSCAPLTALQWHSGAR
jgi:hypothetical protein